MYSICRRTKVHSSNILYQEISLFRKPQLCSDPTPTVVASRAVSVSWHLGAGPSKWGEPSRVQSFWLPSVSYSNALCLALRPLTCLGLCASTCNTFGAEGKKVGRMYWLVAWLLVSLV